MSDTTTIPVSTETRDRLWNMKDREDTYEDIITDLLEKAGETPRREA